jgi:hypothetical protein
MSRLDGATKEAALWAALQADHTRWRTTLRDVAYLAERGWFVDAAKCYGEYRLGQERHFLVEEELFELTQGSGPKVEELQALRLEHSDLLLLVEAAGQALSQWRLPSFCAAHGRLLALLDAHEAHEAKVFGSYLAAGSVTEVQRPVVSGA